MKLKIMTLIVLNQILMSEVFASGMPGCSKMYSATCFSVSKTIDATLLTGDATRLSKSSTDGSRSKEILGPAAQGALNLKNAQSTQEQFLIIENDSNLQNAIAWLRNEGFQGTADQAADLILSLINE